MASLGVSLYFYFLIFIILTLYFALMIFLRSIFVSPFHHPLPSLQARLPLSLSLLLLLLFLLPPSLSYFMAVSVGFLLYLCFFSAKSFISPSLPSSLPTSCPPSLPPSLPSSSLNCSPFYPFSRVYVVSFCKCLAWERGGGEEGAEERRREAEEKGEAE